MEMPSNWSELPFLALVLIFQYLRLPDRFSASQVCMSWRDVESFPCLWRDVKLDIVHDLIHNYAAIKHLFFKYGQFIESLSVVGGERKSSRPRLRPPADFWHFLRQINIQLSSLTFVNWPKLRVFSPDSRNGLVQFVRSQKNLLHLVMNNMALHHFELTDIMIELPTTIRSLVAVEAGLFAQLPPFEEVSLSRLDKLQELIIDSDLLTNEVLSTLKANLKILKIIVNRPDKQTPSDAAWIELNGACPSLKVGYDYKSGALETSSRISPSVPLFALMLSCGRAQQFLEHGFIMNEYLTDILANHRHSLGKDDSVDSKRSHNFRAKITEIFEIRVIDNVERLDETLLQIISCCPKLKRFHFNGVIREFSTLWAALDILKETYPRFTSCHARPKFLNSCNHSSMIRNFPLYSKQLRDENINFIMDDPTTDENIKNYEYQKLKTAPDEKMQGAI